MSEGLAAGIRIGGLLVAVALATAAGLTELARRSTDDLVARTAIGLGLLAGLGFVMLVLAFVIARAATSS